MPRFAFFKIIFQRCRKVSDVNDKVSQTLFLIIPRAEHEQCVPYPSYLSSEISIKLKIPPLLNRLLGIYMEN